MSAGVDLDSVSMDFGTFRAVDNVAVNIQPGEFFSFLGPSGCGKTTILRMISGFIERAINSENNWGKASALGVILLIATLILYYVYNKLIGIDRMKLG